MTASPHPSAPAASPELIAPDTWLIPHLVPAGEGLLLPVNSMVSADANR
jgi:hypothetical protein